jgi:hypothetical protein
LPCLGNDVSSMIHASIGPDFSIAGFLQDRLTW